MAGQFFLKVKNFIFLEQGKWSCPFLDQSKYQNWKIFQHRQIFHELYIKEQYIIFEVDGPTFPITLYLACDFPITLYLACECISSSTILLLSNVLQCTSTRSSDMSKL